MTGDFATCFSRRVELARTAYAAHLRDNCSVRLPEYTGKLRVFHRPFIL